MAYLALIFLLSAPVDAEDWPQYRGPNRDGVSSETGLLDKWPEGGPPVLWRVDAGVGGGSCAIVGDRLYVLGALPDPHSDERRPPRRDSLICLNATTGERLWDVPLGEYTKERTYHSPHVTPTVVDGRVYVASRKARLVCCDAGTGQVLWQVEAVPMMGDADHDHYGYSCSPLVHEGKVIIWSRYGARGFPEEQLAEMLTDAQREKLRAMDPDKRERWFWRIHASMLAFDVQTGDLAWRSPLLAGSTRSDLASPIIGELAGRQMILWATGEQLAALRPRDGGVLWQFDYKQEFALDKTGPSHAAMIPVVAGDLVVDQLWNHKPTNRTYCVRVTETGPELVWQTPNMVSWYHGYVAWNGLLLGIDNQGVYEGAGPNLPATRPEDIGMLQCYGIESGELLWHTNDYGADTDNEKRLSVSRPGYILAEGKLIVQGHNEVSLVSVGEEGARVAGSFSDLGGRGGRAYGLPALANGRLYIRRSNGSLSCYDLRKEPVTAAGPGPRPGE
jgi:outer membrane protein assembly factor BamB